VTVHQYERRGDWFPRLDGASAQPLYEQLIEQVALAVAAGRLRPGDALPSVRGLAGRLRINPNTAARALRDMEAAGLARPERGLGTVVADGATAAARRLARAALDREVAGVVAVARRLGLGIDEVCEAVRSEWKEGGDGDRG
jgi:GntR family transcriptional regulator